MSIAAGMQQQGAGRQRLRLPTGEEHGQSQVGILVEVVRVLGQLW